jgi:ammonium transporter, Amt family
MIDPSIADLTKQVADLKSGAAGLTTAANMVWTLVAGFLVMFMQAGFALVEAGLCRKKNAAHVMAMNFLVYSIGIIGFWEISGLDIPEMGVSAYPDDAIPHHRTGAQEESGRIPSGVAEPVPG